MSESTAQDWPAGMPEVDLGSYVRSSGRESELVNELATAAATMVARSIGSAEVPDAVLSQAILAVGANLYQKRTSATGAGSYDSSELAGNPMRPALDPMTQAWPLLRPYVGVAIA